MYKPIFIGGTGRCGTTVLGDMLKRSNKFYVPVPELKLIVEHGGLRDIARDLTPETDRYSRHKCIENFVAKTNKMFGELGRSPFNKELILMLKRHLGDNYAGEISELRSFLKKIMSDRKDIQIGIYHIADSFGGDTYGQHYSSCVDWLIDELIFYKDETGIYDTDGFISPYYHTKTFDREEILVLIRLFLSKLYSGANGARSVDDTPYNAWYFDFLNELYPDAKLIHIIRNPLDVADSVMNQVWASNNANEDLIFQLDKIQEHHIRIESFSSLDIFTLKLENLTSNKEHEIARLSSFLGEDLSACSDEISFQKAHHSRGKGFEVVLRNERFTFLKDWMVKNEYSIN